MSINKIPVKAFTAGDLALDIFTATAGQTAFTLSVAINIGFTNWTTNYEYYHRPD